MRLRIVWTGKTKDARLRALIDDYLKRLSHFANCAVIEIRESSNSSVQLGTVSESKRITDALRSGPITVLLDPGGTELTSHGIAAQVQRWENSGTKEVAFIIGGPHGVSKELSARVEHRWSLSRLTLTHEMARVLLLEQLYRAYTINRGLPYQK